MNSESITHNVDTINFAYRSLQLCITPQEKHNILSPPPPTEHKQLEWEF